MNEAAPTLEGDARPETGEAAAAGSLVRQVAWWPPLRWALLVAIALGLSSWTPRDVGLVSRVLFVVLLVTAAIGGTSRAGWRLLSRATRSPRYRVLVVGIAALAGFLLLVLQVLLRGPLSGEDVALSRAAARVPHDWVYALAQVFADAGHWAIQSVVLLVVTAVLWVRRRRISALVIAGLSLGLLAAVVGTAKLAFGRARPPFDVHAVHAGGDSFPSGHTAAAVVVGCVLAWLLSEGRRGWVRRLLWVAAALWGLVIGVSRLYLDVHWLTDVLAGWSIGVALACAVYLSYRWLSRYDARIEHALQSALGPRLRHDFAEPPQELTPASSPMA